MIEDNVGFYYRYGDLSYDFDNEHQDHEMADIEFSLIKPHVLEAANSLHLFCGAGRHVLVFSRQNINSFGIDISIYLVQKARKLIAQEKYDSSQVLCGDVLSLPFRDGTFACVTALGNSVCLLTDAQLDRLFHQTGNLLDKNGIFILDTPDFAFLIGQNSPLFDGASHTKEFVSKQFGLCLFTWERIYDPEKKMIFSKEKIVIRPGEEVEKTFENRFFFNTIFPEEIETKASGCRMRLIDTIWYEDPREIYKGMMKRRVFMVFQSYA